jgi:hypothetical protein
MDQSGTAHCTYKEGSVDLSGIRKLYREGSVDKADTVCGIGSVDQSGTAEHTVLPVH